MTRLRSVILGARAVSPAGQWRLLPRHPYVDRPGRSGNYGRTITTVYPWRGRLLVGYGDWNENTGPSSVCSVDPRTGGWQVHAEAIDSEAVDTFRTLGDWTIALHADSLGYAAWNNPRPFTVVETGQQAAPTRFLHAFDAVVLPDGGWLVVGSGWETAASQQDVAHAAITYDRGATFTEYPHPPTDPALGWARFYRAAVLDGLPAAWGQQTGWRVLDGGVWRAPDVEPLAPDWLNGNPAPNLTPQGTSSRTTASLDTPTMQAVGTSDGSVWVRIPTP